MMVCMKIALISDDSPDWHDTSNDYILFLCVSFFEDLDLHQAAQRGILSRVTDLIMGGGVCLTFKYMTPLLMLNYQ